MSQMEVFQDGTSDERSKQSSWFARLVGQCASLVLWWNTELTSSCRVFKSRRCSKNGFCSSFTVHISNELLVFSRGGRNPLWVRVNRRWRMKSVNEPGSFYREMEKRAPRTSVSTRGEHAFHLGWYLSDQACFGHLWQITPSDISSTCLRDKGKARYLTDRWVTRAKLAEKNQGGHSRMGLLWTQSPRGEVVSVNVGLIHVRVCVCV